MNYWQDRLHLLLIMSEIWRKLSHKKYILTWLRMMLQETSPWNFLKSKPLKELILKKFLSIHFWSFVNKKESMISLFLDLSFFVYFVINYVKSFLLSGQKTEIYFYVYFINSTNMILICLAVILWNTIYHKKYEFFFFPPI